MTTQPTQPDLRARDVAIAKLRGFTVRHSGYTTPSTGIKPCKLFKLFRPDGIDDGTYANVRSEEAAWRCVPRYSTDISMCARLLVEVMGRGWHQNRSFVTRVELEKDGLVPVIGLATEVMDPVLAWCAATSEACLKALEASDGKS